MGSEAFRGLPSLDSGLWPSARGLRVFRGARRTGFAPADASLRAAMGAGAIERAREFGARRMIDSYASMFEGLVDG
jgi:hypothetical protein